MYATSQDVSCGDVEVKRSVGREGVRVGMVYGASRTISGASQMGLTGRGGGTLSKNDSHCRNDH